MEPLGRLGVAVVGVAVLAAVLTWLWGHMVFGRHRKARERVQFLVAEVLRDTGQTTFLFVLSPNAQKVEVRIPGEGAQLREFEHVLAKRLSHTLPGTKLIVVPFRENLDHLGGAVSVWGRLYGDVYVARGGVENAA